MARRQILPAAIAYSTQLAESIQAVQATGLKLETQAQADTLKRLSGLASSFSKNIDLLAEKLEAAGSMHGKTYEQACAFRDSVFVQMAVLREDGDKLEEIVDDALWPIPTYSDMLFNI